MSAQIVEPHTPMPAVVDYATTVAARSNFKAVLDVAAKGQAVTIGRATGSTAAVTDAEQLRGYFELTIPARAGVVIENGNYVVIMEGRPFASEGATLEDALQDLVLTLREYAEDWFARLRSAPNHKDQWGLVNFVKLSSDEQLEAWLQA